VPKKSKAQRRSSSEAAVPSEQTHEDSLPRGSSPIAGPSHESIDDNPARGSSPIAGPSNQTNDNHPSKEPLPNADPSSQSSETGSQASQASQDTGPNKPIPFLTSKQILTTDTLKMHIEKTGFQTQKKFKLEDHHF